MSMNIKKVRAVAVPTSVAAGAATDVSDLTSAVVVLGGTWDASYQVQMSLDGTHWVDIGSPATDLSGTAASVTVPDAAQLVRVNCPADYASSSSPSASVGGLKDRSAAGA